MRVLGFSQGEIEVCHFGGHSQRSSSKGRVLAVCLCQTWAFLTQEQEWLVSQAAIGKCRPRDQREGHVDHSQRSSSCHLLIESNGVPVGTSKEKAQERGAEGPAL